MNLVPTLNLEQLTVHRQIFKFYILDSTALMYAAVNGSREMLKFLLESGAKIDAVDDEGIYFHFIRNLDIYRNYSNWCGSVQRLCRNSQRSS